MALIADATGGATSALIILVIFVLYWIPTIVAVNRHHHQKSSIIVINALLGWTFIGWVIALAMSFSAVRSDLA